MVSPGDIAIRRGTGDSLPIGRFPSPGQHQELL